MILKPFDDRLLRYIFEIKTTDFVIVVFIGGGQKNVLKGETWWSFPKHYWFSSCTWDVCVIFHLSLRSGFLFITQRQWIDKKPELNLIQTYKWQTSNHNNTARNSGDFCRGVTECSYWQHGTKMALPSNCP